jgi:hypothetical protein
MVAQKYGASYSASLSDTLNAFANMKGYSNHWWGEDYHLDKIEWFVKRIRDTMVPAMTGSCLLGKCIN